MKDFIKWLGVNEKIAKLIVWLMIIMVFLIITNTMLESLGFPHYVITYENLVKIDVNIIINAIMSCLICILNFYSVMLLVFRATEAKKIFKYSIIYMLLNWLINVLFGYVVLQVFIIIYCIIFCYFYSNKKHKYILSFIIAYIFTIFVQGIWYLAKARFIDYSTLNETTQAALSLDYFIIIGVIILVKEIYLKKRGEKECLELDQVASSGLENSKKKANSLKK